MRVFPVKKLPFAALLWISSPNKKYPITVILLYETSKAVHGLLLRIYVCGFDNKDGRQIVPYRKHFPFVLVK